MRKRLTPLLIISFFILNNFSLFAGVVPYSFPSELKTHSNLTATVDGIEIPLIDTRLGAILNFSMDGPVEIQISQKTKVKSVAIRPLNAGIRGIINENQCRFTLSEPMSLSVEFNDSNNYPVFIFANALEDKPDKSDPSVRYFEAGKIHKAGEIRINSGETVYLEGGAVVHGTIRSVDGKKVVLRGPGIFDCRPRKNKTNMLFFRKCDDVMISDIILIGTLGWSIHLSGSENIEMKNIRVISWRANSDGLDIEYCRKVSIDRCFWRTSDDCIAVKALFPPNYDGMSEADMTNPEKLNAFTGAKIPGDVIGDISITRCVLWNDWPGNAFEVGFELRVDHIRNIQFIDNDIIHVRRGAAFSIHNCDRADIRDIRVENVRVEDTDELFDFYIGLAIYSEDCPAPYRRNNPSRIRPLGRMKDSKAHDNIGQWLIPRARVRDQYLENRGKISNIIFKDIKVFTKPKSHSILSGFDKNKNIENILFDNITIENQLINSADELNLFLRNIDLLRFQAE